MRTRLSILFICLLAAAFLFTRKSVPVMAVQPADPDQIWSIGTDDNTPDEFTNGTISTLVYQVGTSGVRDWRQQQQVPASGKAVYTIRFPLDVVPPAPLFVMKCLLLAGGPSGVEITVNGKRGYYRFQPVFSPDFDERSSSQPIRSEHVFRVALDPATLKSGTNELSVSFIGPAGNAMAYFDYLKLRKTGGEGPDVTAKVVPSIFYKRVNGQLREVADVVLLLRKPLGDVKVELKVGESVVRQSSPANGYDFGERVVSLLIPALGQPARYELKASEGGQSWTDSGTLQPEKQWKLFAGLKIHNDIGYTDLQPHVQELDNRNTDGVIDLIHKFPFYKFNLEDGWLAENYVNSRTAVRTRQLYDLAAKGRIGISAFYLNLMTGMCTGEELYRSLYFAKGLGRKNGFPIRFACLTDAPSHSWFTPTLLKDSGVEGFANGSNQTRAPLLEHSSLNEDSPFYWEGADGSKVITWFARSYLQLTRMTGDVPSFERMTLTVPQFLARYRRAQYPLDAVLVYGLYTDNAAIKQGEAELIARWNKEYAYPRIIPATDSDYYDYVKEHYAAKIPTFKGDAGAYWEDGAGSSALETTLNRDSQRMLPAAEMASALSTAFDPRMRYPVEEFREAWKNLMFYDEHTWGGSQSVSAPDRKEVLAQWDVKRSYAMRANWAATDLLARSLNRLVQNISVDGPALFVFNTEPRDRDDLVEAQISGNQQIVDPRTGEPVPVDVVFSQPGYRFVRFVAEKVPAMGYRAYPVRRGPSPMAAGQKTDNSQWKIESKFYTVEIDPVTGGVARLTDRETGRDLVDSRSPYKINEMLYVTGGENSRLLVDQAIHQPAQLEITHPRAAELVERVVTPYGQRIRVRARSLNVPLIETEITVYNSIRRVDFSNHIRKDEVRSKEAIYFAFPFRVSPPEVSYEIQNTWIRPNADQLPGACRDWFTTQNGVVARDSGLSIAWATPDSPLITLTDINRGRWLKHLDIANGHVYSYPINNYWFTNYRASQGGDMTFRYFLSTGRTLSGAQLGAFSGDTRSPLVAYNYYDTGNVKIEAVKRRMPAVEGRFLALDSAHAAITAFKQAEDGNGYIVRVRETAGEDGPVSLELPAFPLAAAFLTNGVEENSRPLPIRGNKVEFALKAHTFVTIRLMFASAPKALSAGGMSGTRHPVKVGGD
ncbi:MAG: polysaccharide lyase family protein [Bryobacteraceae bacterium]